MSRRVGEGTEQCRIEFKYFKITGFVPGNEIPSSFDFLCVCHSFNTIGFNQLSQNCRIHFVQNGRIRFVIFHLRVEQARGGKLILISLLVLISTLRDFKLNLKQTKIKLGSIQIIRDTRGQGVIELSRDLFLFYYHSTIMPVDASLVTFSRPFIFHTFNIDFCQKQ